MGGGSCVDVGADAAGVSSEADACSSSSEELEEKTGALAGADFRRGAATTDLEAGRGGLKAVGFRLGADFEDSGMLPGLVASHTVVNRSQLMVEFQSVLKRMLLQLLGLILETRRPIRKHIHIAGRHH